MFVCLEIDMSKEEREGWLDLNEDLCRQYSETGDEMLREKIVMTEIILLSSEVES